MINNNKWGHLAYNEEEKHARTVTFTRADEKIHASSLKYFCHIFLYAIQKIIARHNPDESHAKSTINLAIKTSLRVSHRDVVAIFY